MPLIPGVNQRSVTPNAADTPYFKIDATADEFGAGVSKSAQGFATSLLDSVEPAIKLEKKLTAPTPPQDDDGYHFSLIMPQFSPDVSGAMDMTQNFNAGAQGLQNEYLQLFGKDAVDNLNDAQQRIDQLQNNVLANAPTPTAANLARQAITQWANGTKSVINRHATAQQRVYDDDLDDTQVGQGRSSVGQLYNDDQNYLTQLHVAGQARADQVLRASANDNAPADPDSLAATIASARQATASDFTRARIEGALGQGDIATATALNNRWGNDLLPADQDAVDQHLTYASFNQDGQQATTQAMAINQPASPGTPLGRQRNADMVLHRNGGDGAAGDQVADAGSSGGQGSTSSIPAEAMSPLSAGPQSEEPMQAKDDRPNPLTSEEPAKPTDELRFPEGNSTPVYNQEMKAMGPKAQEAETAIQALPRDKFPLIWPVAGPHLINTKKDGVATADGHFGYDRRNRDGTLKSHDGFDITAAEGTPVLAAAGGKVSFVSNNPDGYGNYVVIDHGNGFYTMYGHMNAKVQGNVLTFTDPNGRQVQLRAGDKVAAGQQIGVVGVSGNVGDHGKLVKGGTPHVHFEIRYGKPVGLKNGGTVINPGYFLPQDYNVLDFWPFDPRERPGR